VVEEDAVEGIYSVGFVLVHGNSISSFPAWAGMLISFFILETLPPLVDSFILEENL
jgi:hypothetical protein